MFYFSLINTSLLKNIFLINAGSLETSEKHKSDFVELKTASCSLVSNSFIQALNSTVTPDISEVMKIVNEKPKVCCYYFI